MKPVLKGSFIVIIAVCALGVLSVAAWFLTKPPAMVIQGEVEATHVQVASKVVGRVDDLLVHKGETVQKGQLLVTLDSPEIRARMKQAEAAKSAATSQSEKANKGAREEEIRAALNAWLRAKAGADLAIKTCDRVRRLNKDGVLPAQKLDEAEGQSEAAQRAESAAKAAYQMASAGARIEDVHSAAALADQASGVVAEVSAYLGETRLFAPIGGEIADVIPEKGELVGSGSPVVVIVDLNDVWVTFNMREDLLARISMGSVIAARFPALGNIHGGKRSMSGNTRVSFTENGYLLFNALPQLPFAVPARQIGPSHAIEEQRTSPEKSTPSFSL